MTRSDATGLTGALRSGEPLVGKSPENSELKPHFTSNVNFFWPS
jgi:hypothetical protein